MRARYEPAAFACSTRWLGDIAFDCRPKYLVTISAQRYIAKLSYEDLRREEQMLDPKRRELELRPLSRLPAHKPVIKKK